MCSAGERPGGDQAVLPRGWKRAEDVVREQVAGAEVVAARSLSLHPDHRRPHQELCLLTNQPRSFHYYPTIITYPSHDHNLKWNQCSCSSGQRKGHDSKFDFGKKGKREKCLFSSSEKWEFELQFNFSASFIFSSDTHLKQFLLGNKWTVDCFHNFSHTLMHLHIHQIFYAKSLFWLHSYQIKDVTFHFDQISFRKVFIQATGFTSFRA